MKAGRVGAVVVGAVAIAVLADARVAVVGAAGQAAAASVDCSGDERWHIKTLTDADAGDVSATATMTTVAALRMNDTRPDKVSDKVNRIAPFELKRYRIQATLRMAFREGDGDYHVVIADPAHDAETDPTETMIIEFPDTTCKPQSSSAYVGQMASARERSWRW